MKRHPFVTPTKLIYLKGNDEGEYFEIYSDKGYASQAKQLIAIQTHGILSLLG